MRKNSGFTIIELVVVIAIFSIMLAVTTPSMMAWVPKKRLQAANDELYSNLQYARIGAIKNNEDWALVFNYSANNYTVRSAYVPGGGTVEKTVSLTEHGSGVRYGVGNATKSVPGGSITSGLADGNSYVSPDNTAVFTSRGTASNLGYVYLTNDAGQAMASGTPTLAGVVVQRYWTGTQWK